MGRAATPRPDRPSRPRTASPWRPCPSRWPRKPAFPRPGEPRSHEGTAGGDGRRPGFADRHRGGGGPGRAPRPGPHWNLSCRQPTSRAPIAARRRAPPTTPAQVARGRHCLARSRRERRGGDHHADMAGTRTPRRERPRAWRERHGRRHRPQHHRGQRQWRWQRGQVIRSAAPTPWKVPERIYRSRRQYRSGDQAPAGHAGAGRQEERGKGGRLTTYLSLWPLFGADAEHGAGSGINRKMPVRGPPPAQDIAQELEVPEGMGVILRTAGADPPDRGQARLRVPVAPVGAVRTSPSIRPHRPGLRGSSLVKRSIRDLYNKDIDEILVAGEGATRTPKSSCACSCRAMPERKDVPQLPVFTRYGSRGSSTPFQPVVRLAPAAAPPTRPRRWSRRRQFRPCHPRAPHRTPRSRPTSKPPRKSPGARLRDCRPDRHRLHRRTKRNNRGQRRLGIAQHDRARIRSAISHFGLLEMSRQRIRRACSSDRQMPALQRRSCALGLLGGAAALRSLEDAAQGRDPQSDRAHPHRGSRSISSTTSAHLRPRGALPSPSWST